MLAKYKFFRIISIALCFLCLNSIAFANKTQFNSPDEAFSSLVNILRNSNFTDGHLKNLFNRDGKTLFTTGNVTKDVLNMNNFIKAYDKKNEIDVENKLAYLSVGLDKWVLPIPVMQNSAQKWEFDLKKGKENIRARYIGHNERFSILTCLAYGDAQRDYYKMNPQNASLLHYAQKLMSTAGKKDGLYWDAQDGKISPIGSLLANAGMSGEHTKQGEPIHGYYFKILTRQGVNATGGAYDYIVKGQMVGGFALIATPAKYGKTGIMTFIYSHSGKVYEQNLGKNTIKLAHAIKIFNPDANWKEVDAKYYELYPNPNMNNSNVTN